MTTHNKTSKITKKHLTYFRKKGNSKPGETVKPDETTQNSAKRRQTRRNRETRQNSTTRRNSAKPGGTERNQAKQRETRRNSAKPWAMPVWLGSPQCSTNIDQLFLADKSLASYTRPASQFAPPLSQRSTLARHRLLRPRLAWAHPLPWTRWPGTSFTLARLFALLRPCLTWAHPFS